MNDLEVSLIKTNDGKTFEKEELTDYIQKIQSRSCEILNGGLKEIESKFYICECDPERIKPICEYCFNKCHKKGQQGLHKEIRSETMNAVCYCGYNCHKAFTESGKQDQLYKKDCTFGEIAALPELNFVYQVAEESNTYVCLFCYNICYKRDENLNKTDITELKGFKCGCRHHNHNDIRIIFRKLRSLAKKKHFLKKYNFEGMSFLQFVNFFTSSKNSFPNLFHSFEDQINQTFHNLQSLDYCFEEHNILNDLHLTSQVLFVFSQKFKNEYKIINRIKNFEIKNDFISPRHSNDKLKKVNLISIPEGETEKIFVKCRPLYYINDVIKNILTEKIYFKIMERKFDYKSRNIWQLKYFLTTIFWTFHISRDFTSYPNLKFRDICLLTPLQRLLLISNIQTEAKLSQYVNNLNMNYLNNVLSSIEGLCVIEEKSITVLLILSKLFKMCALFAKYSLFNHEQVAKFCQLNDVLLANFDEEKPNEEKDYIKLKIISQMIKSDLFLAFYYNDQLILSALKNERDSEKLNFVHSKTEICKNITQNVILVLTYLQRFTDEVVNKKYQYEKYKKKSSADMKNNVRSSAIIQLKQILPQKIRYIRCLRNIISNCNSFLSLSLNLNESYFSALVRLIEPGQEIMLKYIKNAIPIKEKEFVKKTRYFTEELEEVYMQFLEDYNSRENEDKISQKFEDIIMEFEKNLSVINESANSKKKSDDNDDVNLLESSSNNDSSINNSYNSENIDEENDSKKESNNDANSSMNNNINTKTINNNILITKSFFLQSMVKYIHVLYYNHIAKKFPSEQFAVKTSILRKMLEILYNFINNSVDNSMFLLQSDFTSNFELLNDAQLVDALTLVHIALETIKQSKRDVASNTNLIHLIKVAVLKSDNLELLNQILKVMQVACQLHYTEEDLMKKKMKKICKILFNYHSTIKTYFSSMISRENDRLQCFSKETEKIVKKYMRVINMVFNGKDTTEEKQFLDLLMNKEQLKKVLYTKTINISLRSELLEFYRVNYIDIILDKSDINYFASILINDFQLEKKDEVIDNPKYYKFFEVLIRSGFYSSALSLENEANVIKFELLNFQEVLTITRDKFKIRKYIETIVKMMLVYFSKLSCLFFISSGYSCLSLYELVYYFLDLKKFIYSREEVFDYENEKGPKVLFINKYITNINDKDIYLVLEKTNHEENKQSKPKKFEKQGLFGKKMKKKMKINPKTDEERVIYDMRRLSEETFQFLNFSELREIFISHTKSFVKLPVIKGFKEYFEKKDEIYDEEKREKMTKVLKDQGGLKTPFEQMTFALITGYANQKGTIDKSSFIKTLDESNTHYNTNFRTLLCKSMVYLMRSYKQKYRQAILWFLFRLLQYNTTEIQETFIDIAENSNAEQIFDFNAIVNSFSSSIISVFLREINPNSASIKSDYFNSIMNIKIMKYFCEEHNPIFQTFFFNNVDASENDIIVTYKNRLKIRRQRNKSNDKPDDPSDFLKSKKYSNSQISTVNNDDYNKKASVFEYLLSVLGKIILVSKWMIPKEDTPNQYFYDIYFVILEFLIETIQGTSSENLSKIFTNQKKTKCLFGKFLSEINHLLIDDAFNSELKYIIRKDMIDFIMAFLEESATPSSGIVEISSVLLPATILDSVIATMCKLYEEKTQKDETTKEIQLKRSYYFSPEMKKFFTGLYFNDMEFGENEKFALANRMYQYFKMLGQSANFKNAFVSDFYTKMEMFTETQVIRAYYNKKEKLINKVTNAAITDQKFIDQYLCVCFFESITRTVFVQKEDEEEPVSVIFTINPIVPLLSKISKEDFIDNVDRRDRYTKLFSLLQRCDNFFEEIRYKQIHGKTNCLMVLITDINFYYVEVIAFLITLTINVIMLVILKGEGDVLYGDNQINFILIDLGFVNLAFNAVAVLLWLISKYNLLYMTECQKMINAYERKRNEDDDEKEITLTFADKIKAAYIVLIEKNKLFGFLWNIIFSAIGSFTEEYFVYICQLFIIFNLSITLRNLISSLTIKAKQLGAVFYCSVVVNLCLSAVAFLNFEEDFMRVIDSKMPHPFPDEFQFLSDIIGTPYTEPAHIESECGSLAYCFATHLDYGMRFDGGIADRMSRRSYNLNKGTYLARFFYEMVYFITQTVLFQGMLFGIVIEAFSELRNKEQKVELDKKEICFICGIDKVSCEKNGQKFSEHVEREHNMWTYVEYILGLRFIDIQETNAINSYVMEKIEKKELSWFPKQKESNEEGDGGGDD